jgi:transcription initiation factor TFIIB
MESVLEQSERKIPETTDSCPECGNTDIIHDYDTGETICGCCGFVIREQMMDEGPEWRAFTPDEERKKRRVGVPISFSYFDKRLSTDIGRVDRDAYGRRLSPAEKQRAWILKKHNRSSKYHDSKDKNLATATSELDRLSDKLSIPGYVKEQAAVVYRKALDKGLIRGRTIVVLTAASLHYACRITGTTRTIKDIAESSPADKKTIGQCYRVLIRELDDKLPTLTAPNVKKYIDKVAEIARIYGENVISAHKLYEDAKRRGYLQGKSPMGDAAGILYYIEQKNGKEKTQDEKTQDDIAKVAGVTVQTVRNRYRSLKKILGAPS